MSNTTLVGSSSRTFEITGLNADWDWNVDLLAQGLRAHRKRITSIKFIPSAINDRMVMRDASTSGATVFDTGGCTDVGARVDPYHARPAGIQLVIKISECILTVPANAKVVISLE